MAVFYKIGAGNFDDANGWSTNPAGPGDTTATDSGGGVYIVGAAGNTLDLNGVAVTLNQSVTAALIQASGATGNLAVSGTRVINANVTYSGTNTAAGMITIAAGTNLTINGLTTNSSSGYALSQTLSGILTASNVGSTVLNSTGSGRCLSSSGTGAITISGNIECGTGYGVVLGSSSAGHSWSGNGSVTAAGYPIYQSAGTLTWTPGSGTSAAVSGTGSSVVTVAGGTLIIAGNVSTSATSTSVSTMIAPILVRGGTLQYTGSRTLAASADCEITLRTGGTINLATATAALSLANSGTFVIRVHAGTLNTADAGAGAASVVNQTTTSYAAIVGVGAANKAIITGPTLPAAGDVDSTAAQFGYAAALVTPTLVVPAEAEVEDGVGYGAGGTEFEGTLAAGGGGVPVFGGHVARRS